MQKSKLIDKLRLVERDEMRDLGKFIASPFFNKDDKVVKLFDYLKKYHPVFDHKKLDRDHIATKLFPEWKDNSYKKLSHIMSRLSQLVDDYFVWKETEYDASERYHALLKAYKRRNGNWFFDSTKTEFRKYLDKQPERGTDYYFHQYRLNHEVYTHNATKRAETGIRSLEDTIDNLDLFYFSSKFRYSSEVRLREMYLADKSKLVLLDEMLKILDNPLFENKAFIHIFSTIVHLYETKSREVYDELKKLIFENFAQFSVEERFDMVNQAINFCTWQYNQGKGEYAIEIFEMYEYGLEQGIWITEGEMPHTVFDNIVIIACRLKKNEWAEAFIKKYAYSLREDVKESVKIMALCRLEFSMNNFEKTLELLRDVEFVDINYNLYAKIFQLRSYYELDGYEVIFYDACNAFAQFCRRNKVIKNEYKALYLNFISLIKKLHQAKYYRKAGKKQLLEELGDTSVVFSDWFRQKIEQDVKDE